MMGKSMLEFGPNMRVMALCPHADDLELGCLATLLYLRLRYQAKINYVLFSKQWIDSRDANAHKTLSRADECRKAAGILGATFDLVDHPFPDREFPENRCLIQREVANRVRDYSPDIVFSPRTNDNHQDHEVIGKAARREVRHGQVLLHYEIKQFGQDDFMPSIFVDVSEPSELSEITDYTKYLDEDDQTYDDFLSTGKWKDTFAHCKLYILHTCMKSQWGRPYFHPELVLGTMRNRALQVSPDIQYAEAFEGRVLLP